MKLLKELTTRSEAWNEVKEWGKGRLLNSELEDLKLMRLLVGVCLAFHGQELDENLQWKEEEEEEEEDIEDWVKGEDQTAFFFVCSPLAPTMHWHEGGWIPSFCYGCRSCYISS